VVKGATLADVITCRECGEEHGAGECPSDHPNHGGPNPEPRGPNDPPTMYERIADDRPNAAKVIELANADARVRKVALEIGETAAIEDQETTDDAVRYFFENGTVATVDRHTGKVTFTPDKPDYPAGPVADRVAATVAIFPDVFKLEGQGETVYHISREYSYVNEDDDVVLYLLNDANEVIAKTISHHILPTIIHHILPTIISTGMCRLCHVNRAEAHGFCNTCCEYDGE
jgi:hypothetical protein